MARVQLIHWKTTEAQARADRLRRLGYDVTFEPFDPFPAAFRRAKADPPDAFVIDLSRLPSHGRDVGLALREPKATRFVPLVFVDGEGAKVAHTRSLLPDATYTTWRAVGGALRRALTRPVADPVVPPSRLAGYSGTPLPKKLGIKQDMTVALLGAPERFEALLAPLPPGAVVQRNGRARVGLALLFVRSRREYLKRFDAAAVRCEGELWVCWPKKASSVQSDLGEGFVREVGLQRGLVDYKIAAVDATWSGLRFTRRKR